jgi:hypothetical protein
MMFIRCKFIAAITAYRFAGSGEARNIPLCKNTRCVGKIVSVSIAIKSQYAFLTRERLSRHTGRCQQTAA